MDVMEDWVDPETITSIDPRHEPDGSRTFWATTGDRRKVPKLKKVDGKRSLYVVPNWCGMSDDDHLCAWGCMGVATGLVAKRGRRYCQSCDTIAPSPAKFKPSSPTHSRTRKVTTAGQWD